MRRIIWIGLLFLMTIPFIYAETQSVDLDIKIERHDESINITINDEVDNDFQNIRCNASNSSFTDTFDNVDIEVSTPETDIANLTKTLIQTNREVVTSCNNAKNLSAEYVACIEGRAAAGEIHNQCRVDRDRYKNESQAFRLLYENETSSLQSVSGQYNSCNTNLLTKNTDYNTCQNDLENQRKKPTTYAIFSAIITTIIVTMYFKSREPKPPEFAQFPES